MNYTPAADGVKAGEPHFLVGHLGRQQVAMSTCPHATSLVAWSETHNALVICALCCKRWGCPWCGHRKVQALARRTEAAKPNRFITLTCWTRAYLGPRNAYDRMRPQVAELTKKLRKTYGEFEYVKVLETHANGFPHWHLAARSPFIPQAHLSGLWNQLAQSPIVHVKRVEEIRSTYAYMAKYLCKQAAVPWTNRRVSWTRHFFPPAPENPDAGWKLAQKRRYLQHPQELTTLSWQGQLVERLTASAWKINGQDEDQWNHHNPLPRKALR